MQPCVKEHRTNIFKEAGIYSQLRQLAIVKGFLLVFYVTLDLCYLLVGPVW